MQIQEHIRPDGENAPKHRRNPEHHRRKLIEATLNSIAEDGISDTTISKIIERAGLSRGMVHLHFQGKDNLIVAAAESFSKEYYAEMDRLIVGTEDNPAALISALISADLGPTILNERSAVIWHAFRIAVRSNPKIGKFSDTRDKRLRHMIRTAFRELLAREDFHDANVIANEITLGTLALLEGMWTDYLAHPNDFSRKTATRIAFRFLNGIMPGHFEKAPVG